MTNELPEYIRDAKFINHQLNIDEELWPREPEKYEPTTKFIQRFREFGSIIEGDIIEDAILYGELYAASKDCVAFVNNLGGVAYYIIVASDFRKNKKEKAEEKDIVNTLPTTAFYDYKAVTIWPFVYDREKALDTGRWSSRELNKIESLIKTEDLIDHIGEYRIYTESEET